MPISVMPYLSRRTCPVNSSHFRSVPTGSAAEPDTMSLILPAASDMVFFSPGDASSHARMRSEEHTSELQSLMRIPSAVFCLKKQKLRKLITSHNTSHRH